MQKQSSIVYNTSKIAVINLSSINCLGQEVNSFSGWIQDVKHGRIFVITCAHNVLANDRSMPTWNSFAATIEAASSKCGKQNISVSMKILGLDVSADIAVLYSILPCEQTANEPLGFTFSSSQAQLDWSQSPVALAVALEPGTPVYSISNIYGSGLIMTTGFTEDDDVIYNSKFNQYTNFTDQLISSLIVSDGSSGAPVLIYDHKRNKGVVVGMVAFTKNVDNYTGGPNLITLQKVYNKLIELNTNDWRINNLSPINFNGKTGKGYIGVTSYDVVNGYVLTTLVQKFPAFNNSKYRDQANGIIILEINNNDITIPGSRVQNARVVRERDDKKECKRKGCNREYEREECRKNGIQVADIVLEVNGVKIGAYDKDASFNNAEYFKAGHKIILKVLRPSSASIIYFKVFCDEYPVNLEYVSVDPTIRLVGFFSDLGKKAGTFLGGLAGEFLGGVVDDFFA